MPYYRVVLEAFRDIEIEAKSQEEALRVAQEMADRDELGEEQQLYWRATEAEFHAV